MEYNTCEICGASNGRGGLLIGNQVKGLPFACLNCHDTRTKGKITIHSNLNRTEEELRKTMAILDTNSPTPLMV